MMMNKNFLKLLDEQQNIQTYAKIIVLDLNNQPIETIEGKVTTGSINVDGSSAVRRTCSLTLVTNLSSTSITDNYWCYNNVFKLEIGKENTIDSNYPPIIWFKQGSYIISSFSVSNNANSLSISIQGKDKMCRLNGEINGTITSDTDFGTIDIVDEDDNIIKEKIPIKEIIYNAVREYGEETNDNIVINDLDIMGQELWEYRGDKPMYYFVEAVTGIVKYCTPQGDIKVEDENGNKIVVEEIEKYYSFNTLDPVINTNATTIKIGENDFKVVKVNTYEIAGYHQIKLVYNSDLILKAGDTVTSLLDKLVQMLGSYEYFYDLDGKFIFQKKKNYTQELYVASSGALQTPLMHNDYYSYIFDNSKLFTAISMSPKITDVKNDFIVRGQKATTKTLIHARYAIDQKPTRYVTPWPKEHNNAKQKSYNTYDTWYRLEDKDNTTLKTKTGENLTLYALNEAVDWREIIYQMAIDYLRHNRDPDFLIKIEEANPNFKKGKTGYEQYYTDIQGFWRQLYCPLADRDHNDAYGNEYYDSGDKKYWNKAIHTDPTSLNFWFEFEDTLGELKNYSVKKIGARRKVITENTITSIYNKQSPEVLYISEKDNNEISQNTSYTILQIAENEEALFARSGQGLSAIEKINELIQFHLGQAYSINITSLPIYYLQPNTRIKLNIDNYEGDYNLNNFSYNLSSNGTMSMTLNKIPQQFI